MTESCHVRDVIETTASCQSLAATASPFRRGRRHQQARRGRVPPERPADRRGRRDGRALRTDQRPMAGPRVDRRGAAHGGADRTRVVAHPPERAARRRRPREGWLGRLRGEPEPPPGQTAPDHPGRALRTRGDPAATAHVGGVPRRRDRGSGAAPGERHADPRPRGPDVLLIRTQAIFVQTRGNVLVSDQTISDRGASRSKGDECMAQTSLLRPDGLVQSPAFTHVAVVPPGATTVYIGGQNAVDGDGALVGGDDVAAQTQQVMKNLHVALAAAGATVHDLVMMTVLFVDGVDLAAAYPVAAAELAGAAPPVVGVRVAGLAVPGALVEVSAVAAVPS